jgi:hypothetical protein
VRPRLRNLAPVRGLRRFARWYVGSLRNQRWPPTVSFSDERVRIVDHLEHDYGFAWKDVRRIGWRTRAGWFGDHLLEFQLADGRVVWVDYGFPGMPGLVGYVDRLPDTRYTERGALANVLDNDSVVIWPSGEAGELLDR